jgi:predicted lipid-binding transport protein (Tim44 family)
MSEGFAYLDILFFAMVAAFIAFRLRSVLGRRTGNERRRPSSLDPQPSPRAGDVGPAGRQGDNVVPMPERKSPPVPGEERAADAAGAAPTGAVQLGVDQIRARDASFDPDGFREGAKGAFGMIVDAFARADRDQLRPLLAPEVFQGFAAAIDEREAKGETLSTELVGIKDAEIVDARLAGSKARVAIRFTSQQINATRDGNAQVVAGDPVTVEDVVDIWTFERDVRSRDPNWQLVETRAPV